MQGAQACTFLFPITTSETVMQTWLHILGSIGLGLTWGWLVGHRVGVLRYAWRSLLVLTGTTVIVLMYVWSMTDRRGVLFFVGGLVCAALIHLGWRHYLRMRLRNVTS